MKKFLSKKASKNFLDNKAQSGTVFRLLIDGIIGLVIFGLILSSMTYFQSLRISTSINEFYSLINSAKESPNGKVFYSENPLVFVEGTGFTSTNLRDVTGLSDECFTFYSNLAFGKVLAEGKMIDIQQNVEARVYVKCYPSDEVCIYASEGYEDCCDILCDVSFGKKLEDEEIDSDTNPKTKDCEPDCKDKACGSDGCEGFCGSCPPSQTCQSGKCISKTTDCTPCPSPSTIECGQTIAITNPCNNCGKGTKCDTGKTCQNNVCVAANLEECIAEENLSAYLTNEYLVIDISGGPSATNYPVTELTSKPSDLLSNSAYKTTKIILRKVPACTFTMGSPEGEPGRRLPHEGNPDIDEDLHIVKLTKSFYTGVFEITQKQWDLVYGSSFSGYASAFGYQTYTIEGTGISFTPGPQVGDKLPVHSVHWGIVRGGSWPTGNKAPSSSSFIGKLKQKTGLEIDLPTESQWEYICRAGTSTGLNTPPNGKQITCGDIDGDYYYANPSVCPELAQISSSWYPTMPVKEVGLATPNNFGLYDLHGNVGEWALDIYDYYIYTNSLDSVFVDPIGPSAPHELMNGRLYRSVRGTNSIGGAGVRCADRAICANCDEGSDQVPFNPPWETVIGPGFRIIVNE